MIDRIAGMPIPALTLAVARERLSLTSGEMDEIVSEGRIKVEQAMVGPRVTEQSIEDFRAAEREQKLRAMREIARISNEFGFVD